MVSSNLNDRVLGRDKEYLEKKDFCALLSVVDDDFQTEGDKEVKRLLELIYKKISKKDIYKLVLRWRRTRIFECFSFGNFNDSFETSIYYNNMKVLKKFKFPKNKNRYVWKEKKGNEILERRLYLANKSMKNFEKKKINFVDLKMDMLIDAMATQRYSELESEDDKIKTGFIYENERSKNLNLINKAAQEIIAEFLKQDYSRYDEFYSVSYEQYLNYYNTKKVSNLELEKNIYMLKFMINFMHIDMIDFTIIFLTNDVEKFKKIEKEFKEKAMKQIDCLRI